MALQEVPNAVEAEASLQLGRVWTMTGEQLYREYERLMGELKIEIETWEELIESEQGVWEKLASKLRGTS